eukprot:9472760-Pyramimonas_sp.AAC.1
MVIGWSSDGHRMFIWWPSVQESALAAGAAAAAALLDDTAPLSELQDTRVSITILISNIIGIISNISNNNIITIAVTSIAIVTAVVFHSVAVVSIIRDII